MAKLGNQKNTLIVIDYTYAFDDVVKVIAERAIRRPDGNRHLVRLIVVDHIMPKVLEDDFFWRQFSGGHRASMDSFQARYLEKPLELKSQGDNSDMLRTIIAASARVGGREISKGDWPVLKALEHLDRIGHEQGARDSVRHPLFAALLGRALRDPDNAPDFSTWSRRDLVDNYFKNKDRLPWGHAHQDSGQQPAQRDLDGLYAGALVSAATLRRGVNRLAAKPHLPRNNEKIFQIAQRVISSDRDHEIGPFLPDILGETFLLKFLEAVDGQPEVFACFLELLSHPGRNPLEQARNFRETIARLTRNLGGDDLEQHEVLDSWNLLLRVLTPENYGPDTPLRTHCSYAIADVMEQLAGIVTRPVDAADDDHGLVESYSEVKSRFEAQVEFDVLCAEPDAEDLISWVRTVFRFFEFAECDLNETKTQEIAAAARTFSNKRTEGWTVTTLASYDGRLRILPALLLTLGEDVRHTIDNGWTAAMLASENGHLDVLKYLHGVTGDEHLMAKNNDGWTAAMVASLNGHLDVLKYLHGVTGDEHLMAKNNDGWTVAMVASQNGHLDVLEYLHGATGDKHLMAKNNDGWTAAMVASLRGHLDVLEYLNNLANAVLSTPTNEGQTVVHFAALGNSVQVLRYLDEQGVDLMLADNSGKTPMDIALHLEHKEIVDFFDERRVS